jgi:mannose-6-phosphate isomerase-like protein (cupin superfamily)
MRGDGMSVIEHEDLPLRERRPGHRVRNLVSPETGARGLTLTVNELDQGVGVPLHTHRIEEALVILEGTGAFRVGDEEVTVSADATVLVPAEVPHAFRNDGVATLKVLGVFPVVDPLTPKWTTYLEGTPPPGFA